MPTTECPFCRRAGLVRHETVLTKGRAYRSHYCGSCNRTWQVAEDGTAVPAENAPPDRSRPAPADPLKRR